MLSALDLTSEVWANECANSTTSRGSPEYAEDPLARPAGERKYGSAVRAAHFSQGAEMLCLLRLQDCAAPGRSRRRGQSSFSEVALADQNIVNGGTLSLASAFSHNRSPSEPNASDSDITVLREVFTFSASPQMMCYCS